MNFSEALNILKEEIEIIEEEKSCNPSKKCCKSTETEQGYTGGEPGCDTKNKKASVTGCEPGCDTKNKKESGCKPGCNTKKDPAVKAAEMPEVSAMVSTILKKNKVPAESVIKLARPIASTILAFDKKNSNKDLTDFDARLYSKLCSDLEKISALKYNADEVADKIVNAYHNC